MRYELRTAAGILPLLQTNLRRPWSPEIVCTDASPSGWGVCRAPIKASRAAEMGSWNDRWRYRRLDPDEWAPRRRALDGYGKDPFLDLSSVDPPLLPGSSHPRGSEMAWMAREGFPEVGDVTDLDWRVSKLGLFKYDEHITSKEGRVMIWSLEQSLRRPEAHGLRHLSLVDNFAVSLAFSKGRAQSFCMLQHCRKLCVLLLSSNISLGLRWFPSEHIQRTSPPVA